MLILVDSGILLRLVNAADPLNAIIDAAVRVIQSRGDALAYALQNAAEFWNVCTRPATARGGLGLDAVETERRLKVVEASFSLLSEPTTAYSIWRQLVVAHAVRGKQVHDARLVALMQAHGISHILTLNGGDFARFPGIVAMEPASVVSPPSAPSP
jgi:predicted nucleic acid-binding protein